MKSAPSSDLAHVPTQPQNGEESARVAVALLILSFPVFMLAVYARTAAAPHFAHAGFWDAVHSELDPVVGLWLLAALTIGVGNALIAVGTLLLARGVPEAGAQRWVRASVIASIVAIAASAVYIFGYVVTTSFTSPTLGGAPLFWVAYFAGFVATIAVGFALFFLAVAWRHAGLIRSKALVIVSLALAIVSIALPPFAVGILALAFGIIRLRGLTVSRRSRPLS